MSNYILSTNQNLGKQYIVFSLGLAALTLGQALQYGDGSFTLKGILWLSISLLCLAYTLFFYNRPLLHGVIIKISFPILVLGFVWQIYQLTVKLPGIYISSYGISTLWQFKLGVIMAGGLALLSLAPKNWVSAAWQNLLAGLSLLAVFLLGIWIIKNSPDPFIDVYNIHQASAEALLHGRNPYSTTFTNIYGSIENYGEALVEGDFLNFSNPYPPLSIYVSTLGYLVGGDIRYSHLLAIVLSGAFIAFLQPGSTSKLAAFIFLFTPRVFFVVEQSWTEPIVMLFLTAAMYCAIHYPKWLPLSLGLLFASKQYLLFLIPLTLLLIPSDTSQKNWIKFYSWIVGVIAVITIPLALWDFPAFIWNAGILQWYSIFRPDSLSYLALYARIFDEILPHFFVITFSALGISFLITWRFAPRNVTGFALGVAFCLGIFFAFNKQAFCNYYFLVIGAICCAFASLTISQQEKVLQE